MSIQKLLIEAHERKHEGILRRWTHYECLKDQLRQMGLPPEEYQSVARKIADTLRI